MSVYDAIAMDYKQSKQLPFRTCIEAYSLSCLLGDIKDRTVLNLACGEGIYSRKLKQQGAARVLGIDISQEMIALAQSEELERSLGCEYDTGNAASLKKLGSFDIVFGSYLLNYAQTPSNLRLFCEGIARNLKEGGVFIGFNDYPENPVDKYLTYKKYGFTKSSPRADKKEGDVITYHLTNPDGTEFQFDNYYISENTYKEVFEDCGFRGFEFTEPQLSPDAESLFEQGFWDDFLAFPPLKGVRATYLP